MQRVLPSEASLEDDVSVPHDTERAGLDAVPRHERDHRGVENLEGVESVDWGYLERLGAPRERHHQEDHDGRGASSAKPSSVRASPEPMFPRRHRRRAVEPPRLRRNRSQRVPRQCAHPIPEHGAKFRPGSPRAALPRTNRYFNRPLGWGGAVGGVVGWDMEEEPH